MIGRLRGILAEVGEEDALIDVGGVGYVVRCGSRTLSRMPPVGEEALIHVETHSTEQSGVRLYGFLTREERKAFVILQSVQGVGPKAALAVLDVLTPHELAAAVAHDDRASVGRAQGVGPKLAQRIVVELKDKPIAEGPFIAARPGGPAGPAPFKPTATGEAVAALMGLGLAEVMARRAVEQAEARLGEGADVAALIKAALQELGR